MPAATFCLRYPKERLNPRSCEYHAKAKLAKPHCSSFGIAYLHPMSCYVMLQYAGRARIHVSDFCATWWRYCHIVQAHTQQKDVAHVVALFFVPMVFHIMPLWFFSPYLLVLGNHFHFACDKKVAGSIPEVAGQIWLGRWESSTPSPFMRCLWKRQLAYKCSSAALHSPQVRRWCICFRIRMPPTKLWGKFDVGLMLPMPCPSSSPASLIFKIVTKTDWQYIKLAADKQLCQQQTSKSVSSPVHLSCHVTVLHWVLWYKLYWSFSAPQRPHGWLFVLNRKSLKLCAWIKV